MTRWRLIQLFLGSGLVLVWATLVLVTQLAFTRFGGPQYDGHSWVVAVALLAVQCLILTFWAHALFHWLGPLAGTALGLTALLAALVISFLPDGTGVHLARLVTPTATLRVLQLGDFPGGPAVATACGIALTFWTLLAATVFSRPRRLPRRRAPRHGETRWALLATGMAMMSLVAGVVLPAAMTRQLPLSTRPFLLLQTISDTAPHQRAQQFLLDLRTNPAGADRLTVTGSALTTLGDFRWAYASLPAGTTFTIDSVAVPHAAVQATGTPYALCLRWVNTSWKVEKIPEPGRAIGPSCGSV